MTPARTPRPSGITALGAALWAKVSKGFGRNVGLLTVANAFGAGLGLVQGIAVARLLGPEHYGVAVLVLVWPSLLFGLLDARTWEVSVRYLGEFAAKGQKDRALAFCKVGYTVDCVISILAFLLILFSARWAAQNIVRREETEWLMIWYAVAFIPRSLATTSWAILSNLGRYSTLAWAEAASSAVRAVTVVGLVALGFGVEGVVWGNALGWTVNGLLLGALAHPVAVDAWGHSWLFGSWAALRGRYREIARFLFYSDATSLIGAASKQLDVVLLGWLRSAPEVAYFNMAKNVSAGVGYLVGPLQWVAYPDLVRLWSSAEPSSAHRRVRRLAFRAGAPLAAAVLAAIPVAPAVLVTLLGNAYEPVGPAVRILLIGAALWAAFFWLRPLYAATGMLRQWFLINSAAAAVSITGLPIVIYYWGYVGLSIWAVVVSLLNNAIAVVHLQRTARAIPATKTEG